MVDDVRVDGGDRQWGLGLGSAIGTSECDRALAKVDGDVMELQPWQAEDNGVCSKLGDKHGEVLILVVLDGEADACKVGNCARFNRSSVDNLNISGDFQDMEWELVMAGKGFVNK